MFEGVYTAMITPFKNDEVDYDSLDKIIESQIKGGVDGIVPMGTTGESPTVSHEEHRNIVKYVVEKVNKRVKVVAGAGSNSTKEAVNLSIAAQEYGVDGVLLVNPYYNKPTQEGLISHFEMIANSIDIPVMLYNIPGRSGVNFLPENVVKLLDKAPNVKAMKEASGDISQMMRLIELCGDRIDILSGDDNLLLPLLAVGGKGVVSVLSNLFPADVKKVINLFNSGEVKKSQELFYKLLPLGRSMFLETNPIPVKAAFKLMGICESEMRLPMKQLSNDNLEILKTELVKYGVTL